MKKLKNGGYMVTLVINPDFGRAVLDNWDLWGTYSGPEDYVNAVLNTAMMYQLESIKKQTGVWYGSPDAPMARGADKVISSNNSR